MSSWIDPIISPLRAAGDVAKGLVDIRDTVKFGEAVIKLQSQILAAQSGALEAKIREGEMAGRIRELEEQLTQKEAWVAEKQRYRLVELPPSVFAYELIPQSANGDPQHYICQTCFQRGRKSILHATPAVNGIHHLKCYECGSDHRIGHFTGQVRQRRVIRSGWT